MKKMILIVALLIVTLVGIIVLISNKGYTEKGSKEVTINEGTKIEESNNQSTKADVTSNSKNNKGDGTLNLVFGGDVLLSESMVNTYNKNGGKPENIMGTNLLEEFINADIAMINQEFPFSLRGTKMEDKQYTFRTDPKYAKVFNDLGIDIVSLANNHVLDYGIDALIDTFDALNDASIIYSGAGNNLEEAKEIKFIEKENEKIAFLSASRVIPVTDWNATSIRPGLLTTYDPKLLIEQIKLSKESADYTVVYVHWGVEHKEMPEEYQKNMAKQYIDAGADVVIGCHTHCLQGIEIYNGKPIVYSMGNFLFGGNIDRTMMVNIELGSEIITRLLPCKSKSYCTELLTNKEEIDAFYNYYRGISFNVDIDENGYVKSN